MFNKVADLARAPSWEDGARSVSAAKLWVLNAYIKFFQRKIALFDTKYVLYEADPARAVQRWTARAGRAETTRPAQHRPRN